MKNKLLLGLSAWGLVGLAGCGQVLDYRGKVVGETTREATMKTRGDCCKAINALSRGKPVGLIYGVGGLVGTLNTVTTGFNDLAELHVGGATTVLERATSKIPVLKYAGRGVNHVRQCVFDDLPGGETYNGAFSLKHPGKLLTADIKAAREKYGALGLAEGMEVAIKTCLRIGTMFYGASLFSSGKGQGGKGIPETPGPTPGDPF